MHVGQLSASHPLITSSAHTIVLLIARAFQFIHHCLSLHRSTIQMNSPSYDLNATRTTVFSRAARQMYGSHSSTLEVPYHYNSFETSSRSPLSKYPNPAGRVFGSEPRDSYISRSSSREVPGPGAYDVRNFKNVSSTVHLKQAPSFGSPAAFNSERSQVAYPGPGPLTYSIDSAEKWTMPRSTAVPFLTAPRSNAAPASTMQAMNRESILYPSFDHVHRRSRSCDFSRAQGRDVKRSLFSEFIIPSESEKVPERPGKRVTGGAFGKAARF